MCLSILHSNFIHFLPFSFDFILIISSLHFCLSSESISFIWSFAYHVRNRLNGLIWPDHLRPSSKTSSKSQETGSIKLLLSLIFTRPISNVQFSCFRDHITIKTWWLMQHSKRWLRKNCSIEGRDGVVMQLYMNSVSIYRYELLLCVWTLRFNGLIVTGG